MGQMLMLETADMCGEVADIVKQFCVNITSGVVSILIHLMLTEDIEAKLIWQSLASDVM